MGCTDPENILRPGEVALRVDPSLGFEDGFADVMQRARTGELRPGDRIGTATGMRAVKTAVRPTGNRRVDDVLAILSTFDD